MNLILHPKGSDRISHFVKNAVKRGNDVFGDNISLYGVKEKTWNFVWTDDEVEETVEKDAKVFSKSLAEITIAKAGKKTEVAPVSKDDIKNLLALSQSDKMMTVNEIDFCLKAIAGILLTEIGIKNKK